MAANRADMKSDIGSALDLIHQAIRNMIQRTEDVEHNISPNAQNMCLVRIGLHDYDVKLLVTSFEKLNQCSVHLYLADNSHDVHLAASPRGGDWIQSGKIGFVVLAHSESEETKQRVIQKFWNRTSLPYVRIDCH